MTDMYISKARERELLEELFETVSFDVESEGIPEDPEGEAYPEDSIASAFDRAMEIMESKGLPDTDPDPSPKPSAAKLRKYWTKGPGATKIRWGTPGQFDRCVKQLREHVGAGAEGLCAVYYHSVNKRWPGRGHKTLFDALAVLGTGFAVPGTPAFNALKSAVAESPDLRQVVTIPAYLSSLMGAIDIDATSNGFKMLWVDTPAVSAKMVEVKTRRNSVAGQNVDSAVGDRGSNIDSVDFPVTIGEVTTSPTPATSSDEKTLRGFLVNEVKDIDDWCDQLGLTSLEKSAVVLFAHAALEATSNTFGIINNTSHGDYYIIPQLKGHKELGIINNHPIFDRINEIQKKAFAVHFGLSTTYGTIDSKELDGLELELKVRRVRTPAGAKRFGQPIGSIIVRDVRMTNLKINAPKFDGWDSVTGANGKNYDVGKVDGEYHAYGENDWDDLVATASTEDELYRKLNDAAVKKGKGKTPKGDAGEPESREMRGKLITVGDVMKIRPSSNKWLRVAKITPGVVEGKRRVEFDDGSHFNLSDDGGYQVQHPTGKKPGKDTTPKRPAGTSRFQFKNKDERDDFVWDNTTYPQWDRYEEMTDAEKTRYAELRKSGKKHRESYNEVMKPSAPTAKPTTTGGGSTVKKPKREPAGPKYDDMVAEAEKLGTPAQAKQIRKFLKNEQMVQDYLDARKKKRSHAQAIKDALDADIARAKERAKGGRSADPKVMAGQGVLFKNPPK